MAKSLKNFLVGIGFDYDAKSAQPIESGIDSIKSKALQLGTVVAGAFGIKALTADFARSTDVLGKFSQVFGATPDDIHAFGQALATEGGSLESFMSQIEGLERLRAGLLVGDAGFIAAAGRAGIDTTGIEKATTATEAYLAIADQFQGLNQQQRINAASALGLDESSIRLLSMGRDEITKLADKFRQARPITEEMTEEAARFNRQMVGLGNNVGGVADQISSALLPQLNNVIQVTNDWFDANQSIIDQKLGDGLESISDQMGPLAIGAGLFVASGILGTFVRLAKFVPLVGGGLVGVLASLSKLTALGSAAAGGYAIGSIINEAIPESRREQIGEAVTRGLAAVGVEDAEQAIKIVDERRNRPQASRFSEEAAQKIIESQGQSTDLDLPPSDVRTNEISQLSPTQIYDILTANGQQISENDANVLLKMVDRELSSDLPSSDLTITREMLVTPEVGPVSPLGAQSMLVTPEVGPVSPLSAQSMLVTPEVGPVSPLGAQSVDVAQMAQPVETMRETVKETTRETTNNSQQRPIQVNLMLDGTVIDTRIIDVTGRQNQEAIDNITSSTRG